MIIPAALDSEQIREHLLSSFEERLRGLGRSPLTIVNYRHHVTQLMHTYPGIPFERMTAEHIERHIYARPVSARSKVAELAGLRSFFQFLIKWRVVKTNPCHDVDRPTYRQRMMPAPTFQEFEQMFALCETLEERVLLNLFFQTAVRLREGLSLRAKHVDLERREIRIEAGKGNRDRIAVFDPHALPESLHLGPIMRELMAGKDPDDYLFPARYKGAYRSPFWFQTFLARVGKQIGLPYKLRPHLLRHGWAMWSAEAGLPIDAAQQQLGHQSIATTAGVYRRLTTPRLHQVIDQHMTAPGERQPIISHKTIDKAIAPVYPRVKMAKADTTSIQIGRDVHDILREVAFKERRTIRAIVEQAVQEFVAHRKNGTRGK